MGDTVKDIAEPIVTKGKPWLPKILKEDLLEKTMAKKQGEGDAFQIFKETMLSNLRLYPGSIAIAIKMCEDSKFYDFLSNAFSERDKQGYARSVLMLEQFLQPNMVLNVDIGKKPDKRSHITVLEDAASARLGRLDDLEYSTLKEVEKLSPEVQKEISALDTLMKDHRDEFRSIIAFATKHYDIKNQEAKDFLHSLLKIINEKHLYKGELAFIDFGTGSGEFTDGDVLYMKDNFDKIRIVRTDVLDYHTSYPEYQKKHNIKDGPFEGKGGFDIIVIKDVTKNFNEEIKGKIWGNVNQDAAEGGFVISGETVYSFWGVKQSSFNVHVKHNGELVKVDPRILEELKKTEGYQHYLDNLGDIIKKYPPKKED